MTICVEKVVHDDCGAHALQIFQNDDGGYSGYCFSCSTYVPDPYHDKPKGFKPVVFRKSPEQIAEEIASVAWYQTVALPERKLKKDALEYFGIKIGLSEKDGETPETHFYPYYKKGELSGYKVRLIEGKKMWSIGDLKDVDLFGWEQAKGAGGKKLFITEGELDAVALYQIFKQKNAGTAYADLVPCIVSLPHGAGTAAKVLGRFLPTIRKHFKEIIIVFDQDEPGRKAAEEVLKVIPDAKVAELPDKDANDCLMKGHIIGAYTACVFNAQKPKNTRLVSVASVVELARQQVPMGFSYPYEKLTQMTRGRRLGETIYIGAGVKMGKSELLNDLVAWDIKEHGWKVFVCKPEESNIRTLQGVVGKLTNAIYHDPAIPFDYDLFDRGVADLGEQLVMLNLYQELSWEGLKMDIVAAVQEGCKSVYIDPITTITNTLDPATANTLLQKMAQELAQVAMDNDILVHLFCHLKAPDGGPPHERGGEVQSQQFAGSRAMMRSCHTMIGIEGNKNPDLEEDQRNLRTLVLLEDRMTGNSGKVPLFWNKHNGTFNELKG
jgi:twinkle protein